MRPSIRFPHLLRVTRLDGRVMTFVPLLVPALLFLAGLAAGALLTLNLIRC